MDSKLNRNSGDSYKLLKFIEDRAGHDKRYAIDASKIKQELGWEPSIKVRVLDDLSNGSLENISKHLEEANFSFIKGDITDTTVVKEAMEDIDIVVHQVALGSVPRSISFPEKTHFVNTQGFLNILNSARENNVKRVVYASSSSVFGDNKDTIKVEDNLGEPLSPYAVSKLCKEKYAKVYSNIYQMDILGLRYFNVFGPRQSPKGPYAAAIPIFIDKLLKKQSPDVFGTGEQTRDFTFIDNVVKANMLSIFSENKFTGESLNIACGSSISINQVFYCIKDIIGSTLEINYKPKRKGDVMHSRASIALAEKKIAYKPFVFFEQGIKKTVEWYKENKL